VIGLLRIEMRAGALAIIHRAIAKFVNVEAMLARLEPTQLADNLDAVIGLLECYLAAHFVIAEAMHRGDGVHNFARFTTHFR
jgi:hypothetical protein